jgi:hypothetical protein
MTYLRIFESPQKLFGSANRKSANHKNCMVCKSQIRKYPILRKVRKSLTHTHTQNEVHTFADLLFVELICGPPSFGKHINMSSATSAYFVPLTNPKAVLAHYKYRKQDKKRRIRAQLRNKKVRMSNDLPD